MPHEPAGPPAGRIPPFPGPVPFLRRDGQPDLLRDLGLLRDRDGAATRGGLETFPRQPYGSYLLSFLVLRSRYPSTGFPARTGEQSLDWGVPQPRRGAEPYLA